MTYTSEFHNALQGGWCVAPLFDRDRVLVTGKDRATFLQNFCTNDVVSCNSAEGCEVFFTNVQGKILAHAFVLVHDEHLILDLAKGQAATLIPHLDRYLIMEAVELEDVSDQYDHILLCGDGLSAALEQHAPSSVSPGSHGGVLKHGSVTIDEAECELTNVNWTNGSLVLTCSHGCRDGLIQHLAAQGAVVGTDQDIEVLRISHRLPIYGRDISEANLPQEVDRDENAINFNKGCYLGQETVARIDALGHVNWLLRSVEVLQPEQVVDHEVTLDGKVAAKVQSQVESPNGVLALAYVRASYSDEGSVIGDVLRVIG